MINLFWELVFILDSVSLGKLMDDLGTNSFNKIQLDIVDKHEKVFKVLVRIEIIFIIIYIISCIYLYNNVNYSVNILKDVSFVCCFLLSILVTFDKRILKWKLKKSL